MQESPVGRLPAESPVAPDLPATGRAPSPPHRGATVAFPCGEESLVSPSLWPRRCLCGAPALRARSLYAGPAESPVQCPAVRRSADLLAVAYLVAVR